MILPCTCKHETQDKLNGRGRRVHNPTKKNAPSQNQVVVRCTVCKDEKTANRD
jgi:hypothetical protein